MSAAPDTSPQVSTDAASTAAVTALEALGGRAVATRDASTTVFELGADQLRDAFAAVRRAGFETNTFVTAVDRFPSEPRFEVSWQFLSVEHGARLRLRVRVAEGATVATCTAHWPGAAFSERECYDMFGVEFDGHPDLRRLLMPEAYEHHPLRKDFPHHGIEPDRLYREWDAERRRQWES